MTCPWPGLTCSQSLGDPSRDRDFFYKPVSTDSPHEGPRTRFTFVEKRGKRCPKLARTGYRRVSDRRGSERSFGPSMPPRGVNRSQLFDRSVNNDRREGARSERDPSVRSVEFPVGGGRRRR